MVVKLTSAELSTLLKRAMRGDTQAFERLIASFSEDIIYNLLVQMDERCRGDVEDAAQDVVLVLNRNIRKLKDSRAFYAYLRTVIKNMAHRYNLKAKRTRTEDVDEHEQAGHLSAPQDEQPEEVFERKQVTALLSSYLEQLPEKQREAVYLFYYRDLSYVEIAERLDITTSTVGSNISKAKGTLKKMLEENKTLQQEQSGGSTDTPDARLRGVSENSRTETMAGFATAPLLYDAIEHTFSHYAVQETAKHLAVSVPTIIAAHSAVSVVASLAAFFKTSGGVLTIVLIMAGATVGVAAVGSATMQEGSEISSSTQETVIYHPEAHIVFEGSYTQPENGGAENNANDSGATQNQGVEEGDPAGEAAEDSTGNSAAEGQADASDTASGSTGSSTAGGSSPGNTEHINPASATVILNEGTVGSWTVVDKLTGEVVLQGAEQPAQLTGLPSGNYTLTFELISPDGNITAQVSRGFSVDI